MKSKNRNVRIIIEFADNTRIQSWKGKIRGDIFSYLKRKTETRDIMRIVAGKVCIKLVHAFYLYSLGRKWEIQFPTRKEGKHAFPCPYRLEKRKGVGQ